MPSFRIDVMTGDGKLVSCTKEDEAQLLLRSFKSNCRLDLHGVLDKISESASLPPGTCVITFMGKNRAIHDEVSSFLSPRLLSKQIDFAVFVFDKQSGKKGMKFTKPGSKAWVNAQIPPLDDAKPRVFIDDSIEHIASTNSLCLPNFSCILAQPDFSWDTIITMI